MIRDMPQDKLILLLRWIRNITGSKDPDDYKSIALTLSHSRHKTMKVKDVQRAFTMYADGTLDYNEKMFQLNLKSIGDILSVYKRHLKPDARPERQKLEATSNRVHWDDEEKKRHFEWMIREVKESGRLPTYCLYAHCYDHAVSSGWMDAPKGDEAALIKAAVKQREAEERVRRGISGNVNVDLREYYRELKKEAIIREVTRRFLQ